MSGFNIKSSGFDKALRSMSRAKAKEVLNRADKVVEKGVRQMANDAANLGPVKTGKLVGSIPPSVRRAKLAGSWQFGSDVEYAKEQEYTNPTKKGFFRKAVFNNRNKIRADLADILKGGR